MKYFLIAGEASGDLHGAALMNALKEHDQGADFRYFGGDLMQLQGGILLKHYREMAFMGGIEVLMNIRTIKRNFQQCKKEILHFMPDVLILIDYPGFNIKIAEFARKNNIRVFWFIAPKVWAWKEWRVKKLKAYVNELFTILPFETEFFQKHQVRVHYVGNPLCDAIEKAKKGFRTRSRFIAENHLDDRPIIALLPGSRVQEIKYMLPVMTRFAADYPDYQFVISGASWLEKSLYGRYASQKGMKILFGQTYELLHNSFAALVTSGTATLETALMNIPQAVLYKMIGGKFFYRLFRLIFLKVKFVSLPNLILGRQAIREFVMDEMRYERVKPELERMLNDMEYRKAMFEDYRELHNIVGEAGAARRAAHKMYELLTS